MYAWVRAYEMKVGKMEEEGRGVGGEDNGGGRVIKGRGMERGGRRCGGWMGLMIRVGGWGGLQDIRRRVNGRL